MWEKREERRKREYQEALDTLASGKDGQIAARQSIIDLARKKKYPPAQLRVCWWVIMEEQSLKLTSVSAEEKELKALCKQKDDALRGQAYFLRAILKTKLPPSPENYEKMIHFLEKGAEARDARSQYALAKHLLAPQYGGVPDKARAIALLEPLVSKQHPGAMYQRAKIFLEGEEEGRDEGRGMALLEAAANQGMPDAQFEWGKKLLLSSHFEPGRVIGLISSLETKGHHDLSDKLNQLYQEREDEWRLKQENEALKARLLEIQETYGIQEEALPLETKPIPPIETRPASTIPGFSNPESRAMTPIPPPIRKPKPGPAADTRAANKPAPAFLKRVNFWAGLLICAAGLSFIGVAAAGLLAGWAIALGVAMLLGGGITALYKTPWGNHMVRALERNGKAEAPSKNLSDTQSETSEFSVGPDARSFTPDYGREKDRLMHDTLPPIVSLDTPERRFGMQPGGS